LRTITDRPVGYAFNALNDKKGQVEAHLASAIITTEIPVAVASLTPKQFVELRERFSELRFTFQRAVRDLCDDHLLYRLSDQGALDEAVHDIARDFHQQVEKFRKSTVGTTVASWAPFSVGVLGSSLGLTGNLSFGLAGFGLGVAVQVYEKFKSKRPEHFVARSQRLISGMRKDLLAPRVVNWLALNPQRI
jgi:hypothetical protein